MALYKDGNPVSGLNSIPRLTLAQYNALTVKPEVWIRTDAPESYKRLSADEVSYDTNNTVKDKIEWHFLGDDITSGGSGVDVSNYNDIYIIPKMQGWAMQYPIFTIKLLNTRTVFTTYVNDNYGIDFAVNFSTSGVLTITDQALRGWTSCTYTIFAR